MANSTAAGSVSWAVVLAGGEGTRMQPMIRSWLGEDRPKQYCTFLGDRSMLQHTLGRVCDVVPPEKTLTVIGINHRRFLDQGHSGQAPDRLIEQPVNRGTAPGVFLPVTQIMEEEPEATVLIVPSDHFIHNTELFAHHIRFAGLLVDQFRDHIVLLGAAPDGPETDYGWIVPGQRKPPWSSHRLVPDPCKVVSFHEKPNDKQARRLYHRGGLWNTMIAVVRVSTLWRLGWQHLPDMMRRFESLRQVTRAVRQGRAADEHRAMTVEHAYAHLEAADFSRDLLERCAGSILVLPMDGVDWSDWGRPERVTSTLARIGKRPSFPITVAAGHDHGKPGHPPHTNPPPPPRTPPAPHGGLPRGLLQAPRTVTP